MNNLKRDLHFIMQLLVISVILKIVHNSAAICCILLIDEDEQTPRKFYSILDNPEDPSKWRDLISYRVNRDFINDVEKRKILDKLARNIKLIYSEYSGNSKKRCRDVNHWINEKIKELEDNNPKGDLSIYSTTVFNDIIWNNIGADPIACKREKEPYKTENVEIMKKLDDYCEIRDNVRCNVLKNEDACLKYNIYIRDKKEKFSKEMKQFCDSSGCNWNSYNFGENCTLDKMDDTFREINCDALYKKAEMQKPAPTIKGRSPLEIGFFIIVSFMLFYLFILFLERVK
ncbi:hypothetical protein PVMG_04871 [Plasmodium vivax Mauritania I]|uniref:Uncharacterized protein n=2 Tax=Plasmodium vivax TaxID=5855 RepID=A0A0J9T7M5_PLAVI|nr:hypothetical protein PVBG_00620 [Plasmodium vivax Brazil I]KMZ91099.1 hypothetical protein PVMG_04871 [Plasmodium vivax Mauritania I]